MFTKLLMNKEVSEILHSWADDFLSPSVKTPENEELAGFLRSMTAIGSITGTAINTDAIEWLRGFAQTKINTVNGPHMKMLPVPLQKNAKAIAKEAEVVVRWIDTGVKQNG